MKELHTVPCHPGGGKAGRRGAYSITKRLMASALKDREEGEGAF